MERPDSSEVYGDWGEPTGGDEPSSKQDPWTVMEALATAGRIGKGGAGRWRKSVMQREPDHGQGERNNGRSNRGNQAEEQGWRHGVEWGLASGTNRRNSWKLKRGRASAATLPGCDGRRRQSCGNRQPERVSGGDA